MELENFRKLKVWQKAHRLALDVYQVTRDFPKHELYAIVSQMRRAAISVVANIVEGTKRKTSKDRIHFLIMADTSLEELKCYFLLSYDLKYMTVENGKKLMESSREVGKMLNGLINSIK